MISSTIVDVSVALDRWTRNRQELGDVDGAAHVFSLARTIRGFHQEKNKLDIADTFFSRVADMKGKNQNE